MKKNLLFLSVVLTALFMLSACKAGKTEVTGDMNGQTITLKPGDTLVLTLEGNPTTGFDWELLLYDENLIKLVGEPEYQSDSKLVGAGGVKTFTFEAKAAGSVTLKLIYHRAWETDVPPEKEFEILVNIQ